MLVRFLTARTFKAHACTYPIRVFADHLAELGVRVEFHNRPDESLVECDVLCVGLEAMIRSKVNRNPPNRYAFLERYSPRVDTLIWFDTVDGAGHTSFSVLPYVDLYAKNQVLRDRMLYTRQLYGNELYSDYYHRRYGIDDGDYTTDDRLPVRADQLHKLAVSWNLGLGDWFGCARSLGVVGRGLKILSPFAAYQIEPTPPGAVQRQIDVSFRGQIHRKQATFSFQREETQKRLAELAKRSEYEVVSGGKLPYRKYRAEMRRTRVVCSPFGLGEINAGRDFECFIDGATLFKPAMDHLETWPDYFEPDVTYVPYSWDFSQFDTKLKKLLDQPDRCRQIAGVGQNRYVESLSPHGGRAFAEHFCSLIGKARKNARS